MSDAVKGVVVAHGAVAEALIGAVERITSGSGRLVGLSNDGLGAEALRARVRELAAPGPTVIFVDLAGGSCGMAGLGVNRFMPRIAVLTGVNLPMLVEFAMSPELGLEELIERLLDKGRSGMVGHGCSDTADDAGE